MAQTVGNQVTPSLTPSTTAGTQKDLPDILIDTLIDASLAARNNSYSPYSKFAVGAALLTHAGEVHTGCNVENVSYGLTVCAERTAVCRAVADGQRDFRAIVITADMGEKFVSPCGACRQTLAEFGINWDIYMAKPDKSYTKATVGELLPDSFNRDRVDLGK